MGLLACPSQSLAVVGYVPDYRSQARIVVFEGCGMSGAWLQGVLFQSDYLRHVFRCQVFGDRVSFVWVSKVRACRLRRTCCDHLATTWFFVVAISISRVRANARRADELDLLDSPESGDAFWTKLEPGAFCEQVGT